MLATSTVWMSPLFAADARTLRLVVPFPAGGAADGVGRILALSLGETLGTTFIVDNVAGATGRRGTTLVAHAVADGRTLILGTSATHAIAPSLFKQLAYRPERDFVAVGQVATTRLVLVTHTGFPARSLADLLVVARTAPIPLAYGSWGIGSGGHLAVEAIRQHVGIDLNHIAYQGTAPMMQALLSGQIPLAISDMAGAMPLLSKGRIVPLVISGPARLGSMPNLPTLSESGVPYGTESWYALFAPGTTPTVVLERLDKALQNVLKKQEVIRHLEALGLEPKLLGSEAFTRLWQHDTVEWRRVVARTGIRLE